MDVVNKAAPLLTSSDSMIWCYRDIEKRCLNYEESEQMRYPFIDFDICLGPMEKGELIVVAGRPGMGQNAWLSRIMELAVPVKDFEPVVAVTGNEDMTLGEYDHAVSFIHNMADENTNIMCGMVCDSKMGEEIRVTVIVAGLGGAVSARYSTTSEAIITLQS